MGVVETLNNIKNRVYMELFQIDLEEEICPSFKSTIESIPGAPWSIRVLSLNVWGIPVSPHVIERAGAIGRMLEEKANEFDIVTLQEVWHRREKNIILKAASKAGFGYSHYFHPAVGFPLPIGHDSFGTGLLILSKYRLSSAMYHPFLLTGRPYALHEADFIANKGVGLLRVHHDKGEVADLYVTHLLANYNHLGKPGPGDTYLPHRVAQSYELACFISETSRNDLVIVCGDFNSPSDCIVLDVVRDLVSMRDAFRENNPNEEIHGLTFGTEDNKFSHGDHPMRMDYILFRTTSNTSWQLQKSGVFKGYFTTSTGEECPLSDHFGVHATFRYDSTTSPCEPQVISNNPTKCLQDVQDTLSLGRQEIIDLRISHLKRAGFGFFMVAIGIAVNLTYWSDPWSVWNRVAWYFGLTLCLIYALFEYIVAFFVLTLEVSCFTELKNQARLHAHSLEN